MSIIQADPARQVTEFVIEEMINLLLAHIHCRQHLNKLGEDDRLNLQYFMLLFLTSFLIFPLKNYSLNYPFFPDLQ